MPGNEVDVAVFLFTHIGKIHLKHLGDIKEIGIPGVYKNTYNPIKSVMEAKTIHPDNASKKADFYVNGRGVSVKQSGSSFAFNRLQRANLEQLFKNFNLANVDDILATMDAEVNRFHNRDDLAPGMLRDRPWRDFFSEDDFHTTLELLMMMRSPNYGLSDHPAELILEAPKVAISEYNIKVHTFEEYFETYKERFRISIRRSWYGQDSKSEHSRARSLMRKPGNKAWVFDSVSGEPRSGWRSDIPEEKRKTAYFMMISKV